ncbi:MAG: acyltransferase [Ardenticatenaceae bacterium]|nr:acyltransferase [Anaerolineales bacterium]MCB8923775.1 acyltransferase [Ardenticatenaceae bacterium]MCB8990110.1 acyltransferase [Ardenticatenaceae bacterium]
MVRRLLYLNGIAIVAVILFHSTGWGFTALFAWDKVYLGATAVPFSLKNTPSYYALRIMEQTVMAAIPVFLFVSGYFIAFATGRKDNIGWPLIGARVKNLIVPYVLWGALALLMLFVQGTVWTPKQYLVSFLIGNMTPAYYYIPLLIQLYAISPFIVPLAKKRWKLLLAIAVFVQLLIHAMQFPMLLHLDVPDWLLRLGMIPKWFFPTRFLWFTLGIVVGFNLTSFKQALYRWRWVFLGTAVLLIPLGVLEWEWILRHSGQQWIDTRETLLDSIYSASMLLAFIAFDKMPLPQMKRVSDWGTKSFGIYLAHIPVMEVVARGIYHVAPAVLGYQILFVPIIIVTGMGIPLLMMYLINLSPARRFYTYIFG